MGVKPCHRNGCASIMCDTYINGDGLGYICHDCQKEFVEYLAKLGAEPSLEGEIKLYLFDFMKTKKSRFPFVKNITVEEFFNNNTH